VDVFKEKFAYSGVSSSGGDGEDAAATSAVVGGGVSCMFMSPHRATALSSDIFLFYPQAFKEHLMKLFKQLSDYSHLRLHFAYCRGEWLRAFAACGSPTWSRSITLCTCCGIWNCLSQTFFSHEKSFGFFNTHICLVSTIQTHAKIHFLGFVLDAEDYLPQCQFDEELWKRINAAKKGHAPADVQPVLRMNAIP
jgi:hypothetical protein